MKPIPQLWARYNLVQIEEPPSQERTSIQRFKMFFYLLLGLTFATLHHFIYLKLSGRPAGNALLSLKGHAVLNQTIIKGIGNAISIVVSTCFASAISIAFAQHFWRVLRTETHKVRQVNAAFAASKGSPLSTLSTIPVAPVLALMAMAAVAKPLITVFAPGSLSVVAQQYSVPNNCSVNTANITKANLASYYSWVGDKSGIEYLHNPTIRTSTVVSRVILGGSYILPPSPCGTCSYTVSFTGAGAECTNATDYRPRVVLRLPEGPASWLGIWNASYSWTNNTAWTLRLGVRNGSFQHYTQPIIYECRAYRADYQVKITHGNVSTAEVLSVSLKEPIPGIIHSRLPKQGHVMKQLNGILGAVGAQLNGSIVYRQGYCVFDTSTSVMASSPILDVGSDCANYKDPVFTWPDMQWAIPSLIQNVSITLLSGLYPSAGNDSYLEEVDAVCLTSPLTYDYAPTQLLATYAVALSAVLACLLVGLCAVSANGGEENLDLIRFMKALSRKDVAKASDKTVGDMDVEVQDREGRTIIILDKFDS